MIQINKIKPIDDEKQLVLCTVFYNDQEYQYPTNTPVLSGDDLQVYLDTQEDRIKLRFLKHHYPDADYPIESGQSELEAFEAWVNNGGIIYIDGGEKAWKVEKQPWTYTHPEEKTLVERLPEDAKQKIKLAKKKPTVRSLTDALTAITEAVID